MHRWLADQNFRFDIVRGLRLRSPDIDIVRTQDLGLEETADDDLLGFADRQGRVVLTHDRRTMPRFVAERVAAGDRVVGLVLVEGTTKVSDAIEQILMIDACLGEDEVRDRVTYVPIH